MGKPFSNELNVIPETIAWALALDVKELVKTVSKYSHPVYVVGSGGSFSACVYAANLLSSRGIFAKAVTPLELFYLRSTLHFANLIFISASGRNTDILFAFKKAIESEPISITGICMRKKTKLSALAAEYSACNVHEYALPVGKDGFLATNSLAAYFVILYRSILSQAFSLVQNTPADQSIGLSGFISRTSERTCFTLLYGGYHQSVAVDLESKFSEAGLAPSLISDFRHFAHGRHNWFDKQPDSAIIALCSPSDEKLAQKTLSLLPPEIPAILLKSTEDGFAGTIELLTQAMELINLYGKVRKIDPGRPGVPPYGSKIYHLSYERLLQDTKRSLADVAIARKAKVEKWSDLPSEKQILWKKGYDNTILQLTTVRYGCLVFDYDGTLCSSANRFTGMGSEIKQLLVSFAKRGFVIGVISGRGKSLREELEKVFVKTPKLMEQVVVGYYNGGDIGSLTDNKKPNKTKPLHASLQQVESRLLKIGIQGQVSPNQLTFGSDTTGEWVSLRETLLNEVMLLDLEDLTVVESSHSIDIIPRKVASKNHILSHCRKLCTKFGLAKEALCIGDKGQWPGNDYALLANKYALSVGDVSSDIETGWNLCPPGLRDEKAVAYLFSKLNYQKGYFTFGAL